MLGGTHQAQVRYVGLCWALCMDTWYVCMHVYEFVCVCEYLQYVGLCWALCMGIRYVRMHVCMKVCTFMSLCVCVDIFAICGALLGALHGYLVCMYVFMCVCI